MRFGDVFVDAMCRYRYDGWVSSDEMRQAFETVKLWSPGPPTQQVQIGCSSSAAERDVLVGVERVVEARRAAGQRVDRPKAVEMFTFGEWRDYQRALNRAGVARHAGDVARVTKMVTEARERLASAREERLRVEAERTRRVEASLPVGGPEVRGPTAAFR